MIQDVQVDRIFSKIDRLTAKKRAISGLRTRTDCHTSMMVNRLNIQEEGGWEGGGGGGEAGTPLKVNK